MDYVLKAHVEWYYLLVKNFKIVFELTPINFSFILIQIDYSNLRICATAVST